MRDQVQKIYQDMQANSLLEEVDISSFSKPRLIQLLQVMTKFSEKFLKLQDEEVLKTLASTFMAMDKAKMKKDLGITTLTKPTEAE